ncbi:TetR/AcrR family transcriptional regulator [Myxococcota bacterium]|nr:TetR/AcrR family transcriptional regulator [Myxococcota bacterium]
MPPVSSQPTSGLTPSQERRRSHRDEARRSILDATESILVEDGYEHFSMRRLASRCGYTTPTIYHYFGDKQHLLDSLLEERFARLVVKLRRVRSGPDPEDLVRAQGEAFVRFGLRNPNHYQLLMARRPDDVRPPASVEQARIALMEPLQRLALEERLWVTDVEEASQLMWTMLHGMISLRINRPDLNWTKSTLRTSLDILVRGLVRPADRATSSKGDRDREVS